MFADELKTIGYNNLRDIYMAARSNGLPVFRWRCSGKGVVIYYMETDAELARERALRRCGERASDYPPSDDVPDTESVSSINGVGTDGWQGLIFNGLKRLEDLIRDKTDELQKLEATVEKMKNDVSTMNNPPCEDKTENIADRISEYVTSHPGCTVKEVHEANGCSVNRVREVLRDLCQNGSVVREVQHDKDKLIGYYRFWKAEDRPTAREPKVSKSPSPKRKHSLSVDGRAPTWRDCYERGMTLKDISKKSGVSPETIRRVLVSAGVAMRSRGNRKR